jgi:hypothetical protein
MTIIKKGLLLPTTLFFSLATSAISVTYASDFSIAQIPDTQGFMGKPGNCADPSQVSDMYEWIFNDSKNYQYIFQVGDIIGNPGYIGNPFTAQWNQAKTAFQPLISKNQKNIPYGFATGNHDYLWPVGKDGYGDYTNKSGKTIDSAYKFLEYVYQNPNNGNEFIDDPLYSGVYPSGKFYLISYHKFNIKGHDFVALNLPYGLTASATGMQKVRDFIDATNALFILNVHTPANTQYQSGRFDDALVKQKKKIFLVLYGHDPDGVSRGTPYSAVPQMPSIRGDTSTPAYVFRFDYQDTPGDKKTYSCDSAGSNMPQHPLLRTYDFTVDSPSEGWLTWTAQDVQAWTSNSIYDKARNPYWQWSTSDPRPLKATTKPYGTEYKIYMPDYLK